MRVAIILRSSAVASSVLLYLSDVVCLCLPVTGSPYCACRDCSSCFRYSYRSDVLRLLVGLYPSFN